MILDQIYFASTVRQWLVAAAVATVLFAVLLLARRIVVVRLGAIAQRTTTHLDDIVVDLVRGTHGLFLLLASMAFGGRFLTQTGPLPGALRTALVLAFIAQAAKWGGLAIAQAMNYRAEQLRAADPASATTLGALSLVLRLGLYAVLLLVALDNLGINVTALVAGLGIGGIAIALATQNILGDLFASLSIVLDKPFVVGDFIIVGDLLGTVEHVGLKTTRIRSLSGEQIIFSNADLLGSRIRNFKRMLERRVVFEIGVVYQTPREQVAAIPGFLREIVEATPGTRIDRAHFKKFADSALVFEVVYWMLDPDYNRFMDAQQQVNLAIMSRFEAERIEFAYPTRTLHIVKEAEGEAPK